MMPLSAIHPTHTHARNGGHAMPDTLFWQGNTHLQHAIHVAYLRMEDAWEAYLTAPLDDASDMFHAYQLAATRHSTLIEAGMIFTTGYEGDDTP